MGHDFIFQMINREAQELGFRSSFSMPTTNGCKFSADEPAPFFSRPRNSPVSLFKKKKKKEKHLDPHKALDHHMCRHTREKSPRSGCHLPEHSLITAFWKSAPQAQH